MTRVESIIADIERMKADGGKVEINYSIPTVRVMNKEAMWFFQGDEAADLIKDAEESVLKEDIEPEDLILWCSAGW